jgi:hypothetical protein
MYFKTKMNQKISTSIGTAIIIIIAITVGVFVWKYEDGLINSESQIYKTRITKQINDASNLSKSPGESDTWLEYIDQSRAYEVSYPGGYSIQKYDSPCTSSPNNETGENIVFSLNKDVANHDNAGEKITNFTILTNDPDDKCISNAYSSISGPIAQKPKIISSEILVVNGNEVLKRTYAHRNPDGSVSSFNFSTWRFKNNSDYYTLSYNNGILIENPEAQGDIFAEFIAGFRFEAKIYPLSEDVDFCGKVYKAETLVINKIDVIERLAEIAKKDSATFKLCKNLPRNIQGDMLGVSSKNDSTSKNTVFVIYDKTNERQIKDPFSQSTFIFKLDINGIIYYQDQFTGSFNLVGSLLN